MRATQFASAKTVVGIFAAWAVLASVGAAAERSAKSNARAKQETAASTQSVEAASLVQQALSAEAKGRNEERDEDLRKAVELDPSFAQAHWQLGEIKVGDEWLPVESAAAQNVWSSKFLQYRQRRDKAAATADGQIVLARWCEDAELKDQEKMHLQAALYSRPSKSQQRELISKLGLVRYRGNVMPAATADARKHQAKQTEAALQHWKPILTRSRNDLESRDKQRQASAAEQLKSLQNVEVIPALEAVFAKSSPDAGKAAIAALAAMPQQAATDSLIRHAILAQHVEVRKAAAHALKERDTFTYVPVLLAGMNTPIDISFQYFSSEGGAFGERLSLYREGQTANYAMTTGLTAMPNYSPRTNAAMVPVTGAAEVSVAQHGAADALLAAAAMEENSRTEQINQRVAETLRETTDSQVLTDDAKAWWDWWWHYNETHWASDKPTYETNRNSYMYYSAIAVALTAPRGTQSSAPIQPSAPSNGQTYTPPPAPRDPYAGYRGAYNPHEPTGWHIDRPGMFSCFVPGTLVWTVTGTLPIEDIRPGDWVLSQDVETAELAYKPVEHITKGPPLALVEIRAGGELIRSTLGHLFWVSGTGWRMAKELKAGDRLRTSKGTLIVESADQTGEAGCHNLIVQDFNTFFVTDQQILVHDINFRRPTTGTVPGLAQP